MQSIRVFTPASIGNFIVGFDLLGAAIESDSRPLGDDLVVFADPNQNIECSGEFSDLLPAHKENLIHVSERRFNKALQEQAIKPQKLSYQLTKHLPAGSGLGSSSASIVASLYALNEWYQRPFNNKELLLMAAEVEGGNSGGKHFDNVAPALFGGLQLINAEGEQPSIALPTFKNWHYAICFPDIQITTKSAREILPKDVSLAASTTMQARLAAFIAASYQQDENSAHALLQDDVIEPCRSQLIPGFAQAKQACLDAGALSFGISGSGPTCFAITQDAAQARTISELMLNKLGQGSRAFACVAQLSEQGTRLVEEH